MAKLKNIEKVAKILGGTIDRFSDNSQSWMLIENDKLSITMCFDGKGEKFEFISIAEKVYKQVDEKLIGRIEVNNLNEKI